MLAFSTVPQSMLHSDLCLAIIWMKTIYMVQAWVLIKPRRQRLRPAGRQPPGAQKLVSSSQQGQPLSQMPLYSLSGPCLQMRVIDLQTDPCWVALSVRMAAVLQLTASRAEDMIRLLMWLKSADWPSLCLHVHRASSDLPSSPVCSLQSWQVCAGTIMAMTPTAWRPQASGLGEAALDHWQCTETAWKMLSHKKRQLEDPAVPQLQPGSRALASTPSTSTLRKTATAVTRVKVPAGPSHHVLQMQPA